MKLKFELSKLALRDVNNIWEYTSIHWSKSQANKYYKLIFKEIDNICENPELGKSIAEVKNEHRILLIKSHFVVYKLQHYKILIDRVLHQRVDIENILSE